jgi:hypothetical protein
LIHSWFGADSLGVGLEELLTSTASTYLWNAAP